MSLSQESIRKPSAGFSATALAGTLPQVDWRLPEPEPADLEAVSLRVREHVIRMATEGGCFVGASLSCVDLIVYLYSRFLNIDPDRPEDPHRDYLFLSKGHDVPALYGTLAELGFIQRARLKNHLKVHDDIYWHPNRNIPGVEYYSGSLGHLLPVAMGVAYNLRLRDRQQLPEKPPWVVVITGDGELDEGSNWEACLVAGAYKLDNLIIVVDRNRFQANMRTEDLIPLEPLEAKFEAFGCRAARIDGHDFCELDRVFSSLPLAPGRGPSVIIAETIRGKGLPSIEQRADRWFCDFSQHEIEQLLGELHGDSTAQLTSDVLVVR